MKPIRFMGACAAAAPATAAVVVPAAAGPAGSYTMAIRYANGGTATSTQGLAYNGGAWSTVSLTGHTETRPEVRVRIGEKVRAAHVNQFCPGGLGFPVTSPSSVGLDLEHADFIRQLWLTTGDHAAHAAGERCVRCGKLIEADHDVRRRLCGDWVHETCPPTAEPEPRLQAAQAPGLGS
jgi:hypothetical protein